LETAIVLVFNIVGAYSATNVGSSLWFASKITKGEIVSKLKSFSFKLPVSYISIG
jgi:hypothetical protein